MHSSHVQAVLHTTLHSHLLSRENDDIRGWQAAALDIHLVFPQYPRGTTKPPSPFTLSWHMQCAIGTYPQLVQSNCSSLGSFAAYYLSVSLGYIAFWVFQFGILATLPRGKTYVCTGVKGEGKRARQNQAHWCMVSLIITCPAVLYEGDKKKQYMFYYSFQEFS